MTDSVDAGKICSYWQKRLDLALPGRDVIHDQAPLGLCCEMVVKQQSARVKKKKANSSLATPDIPVGCLRHSLVAAIASAEVHIRSPVVGPIFFIATGRAGGYFRNVGRGHRYVERITPDDLVQVRGRREAGVHEGVDAVDDDLVAAKSALC
jgi:hypothetical protein